MPDVRIVSADAAPREAAPFPDRAAVRELIRHALLAPSSHNTQPWRFRAGDGWAELHSDPHRWAPAADPDGREMRLSLGAVLESLVLAAEHHRWHADVRYLPDPQRPGLVARVVLLPDTRPRHPSLFPQLARRRTNRRPYAREPIDAGLLRDLETIAWDLETWAWSSTDPEVRREIAGLVARGDRVEYADPAFRRELGSWIGRGLLGLSRPAARLASWAVTRLDVGERMARRDAGLVEGAAAVLVIATRDDDPIAQLRAGRSVQRVWLLATQLGLAAQPMSQPLAVPHLRDELAAVMGITAGRPQHLFRLGYAEPDPHRAPRRPVEEVLLP